MNLQGQIAHMAEVSAREDHDMGIYRQRAAEALKSATKWQHKCKNQAKEMGLIQYEVDKAKAQMTTLKGELQNKDEELLKVVQMQSVVPTEASRLKLALQMANERRRQADRHYKQC